MTEAVVGTLFSALPGLDEHLARDVTDIFVNGCDDVRLRLVSGDELRVAPIAPSDDELVALVQGLARRGGYLAPTEDAAAGRRVGTPGGFSPTKSDPRSVPVGRFRLAAAAWVTTTRTCRSASPRRLRPEGARGALGDVRRGHGEPAGGGGAGG